MIAWTRSDIDKVRITTLLAWVYLVYMVGLLSLESSEFCQET